MPAGRALPRRRMPARAACAGRVIGVLLDSLLHRHNHLQEIFSSVVRHNVNS